MAWKLARRLRKSIEWRDDQTGQRRLIATTAPLAYEDADGRYLPIDATPERVSGGWQIVNNGWRYRLLDNGTVGFGARRGAHWFSFRLFRAGYVDARPDLDFARDWRSIGATANYAPSNLTRETRSVTLLDETIPVETVAEWRNLWTTPGGGEIYIRWQIDGDRLKEDVVINAAARSWIAANRPPAFFGLTGDDYFALAFQVDWGDIPKRTRGGAQLGDRFDDADGGIEARDALDELLFFLPLDEAYVEQDGERVSVPLRKRFWRDADGNHYLVIGAPASALAALPAGDLVIDPTISTQIGAGADDAWQDSGSSSSSIGISSPSYGTGNASAGSFRQAWHRYPGLTIDPGSTIDSAQITLRKNGDGFNLVQGTWRIEASANSAAWSSGENLSLRSRGVQAVGCNQSLNRTDGTWYQLPTGSFITALIQECIDQVGWSSGNALALFFDGDGASSFAATSFRHYNFAAADAPQLDVTWTEPASGGQTADAGLGIDNDADLIATAAPGLLLIGAGFGADQDAGFSADTTAKLAVGAGLGIDNDADLIATALPETLIASARLGADRDAGFSVNASGALVSDADLGADSDLGLGPSASPGLLIISAGFGADSDFGYSAIASSALRIDADLGADSALGLGPSASPGLLIISAGFGADQDAGFDINVSGSLVVSPPLGTDVDAGLSASASAGLLIIGAGLGADADVGPDVTIGLGAPALLIALGADQDAGFSVTTLPGLLPIGAALGVDRDAGLTVAFVDPAGLPGRIETAAWLETDITTAAWAEHEIETAAWLEHVIETATY